MTPLNTETLPSLRGHLPTPTYDRGNVRVGIVHFGVGGFHRAHQAMYLDRLMNEGRALDWGICGVGVMAADRGMPEAVIETMAAERTRIVSLTVTEGGYNFHAVTGEFDAANPDVAHDLQPGATPRTVFGLITEALARRRQRGLPPFTVMSCDNIQGNGAAARKSFAAFAALRDADLGEWVAREVRFPNSMVDRITP